MWLRAFQRLRRLLGVKPHVVRLGETSVLSLFLLARSIRVLSAIPPLWKDVDATSRSPVCPELGRSWNNRGRTPAFLESIRRGEVRFSCLCSSESDCSVENQLLRYRDISLRRSSAKALFIAARSAGWG